MAAAIIALILEANPALTWRDVQHIMIKTSRLVQLIMNTDLWFIAVLMCKYTCVKL